MCESDCWRDRPGGKRSLPSARRERQARPSAREGHIESGKVASLRTGGAEIAVGDLKDRESLAAVCRGAHTVISTASSTLSRQEGDSIETAGHAV